MSIKLPESIENYFRFSAEGKAEEAAACFALDAVIFDKGEDLEIAGREAIGKWFVELDAKYKNTLEIFNSVEDEGEVAVTAFVSGNFPGSPAEFCYRFVLRDGLIERLAIEFVGFMSQGD